MLRYSQYSCIALIVLSSLVYGLDNPTSQKHPQAVEVKTNTDTESSLGQQEKASTEDRSSSESPAPIPEVTTPLEKTDTSDQPEKTRQETTEADISWWKLTFADALTILFMCAVAIFTFLLWRSTDKLWAVSQRQAQSMETSNQTNYIIAHAAEESAKAASDTVKSMNDIAERQLRAYMSIDKIERTDDSSQLGIPEFNIEIINTGQTPAYEVKINFWLSFREYPLELELEKPEITTFTSKGTFGTGQPGHSEIKFSRPITIDDIQMMNRGKGAFYIYGEIQYRDVFLKQWHTKFVFCYLGEKAMPKIQIYKDGNEAT